MLSSINIFFATTYQGEKCPNQKNLTFCQLTSAKVYVKGSQSEDDDVSVSEDSEIEDELLLEFGDVSNSGENDSKDSESEEED